MESLPPVPPENPPGSAPGEPPAPPSAESPAPPPAFAPPWPAPAAPPPEPLPWERPGGPTAEGFFATLRLLLFRPREAFARLASAGGYARPIAFALILGVAGTWVAAGFDWILGDPFSELVSHLGGGGGPEVPRFVTFLMTVVGAPFLTGVTLLLTAALYHLFLLILGGSGGGFGATFRVACYSMAGYAWLLVPLAGSLVGGVWMAVLGVYGLAAVHRIGYGKAAAAVVLPFELCCLCCAPFFFFGALRQVMNG